jgi:hypothetical protein
MFRKPPFAMFVALLAFALAKPAFANWTVDGMRVASISGYNIAAVAHDGSATDNFTVDQNTVVQLEVPGTLSDIEVGKYIRLITPERGLQPGVTAVTAKRIQILEIPFKKNDDDAAAGYARNYVQGIVTSLSPYLQIETPGGVTVTAALARDVQVVTYRFGSLDDIVDGAHIDANLHLDKDTNAPVADKVWIWDTDVN